jgi:1-acyl-sn-glycerol-3-phosphate acyltransferase
MKIFKEIAARIWAFWAIVSFILTFLIIFIPSMIPYAIPDPKGQDIFIKISRVWMTCWLYMVGCPLKVKGREHFTKDTAYIVVCNHNSMLDIPISCPFIPGPNKTIAKNSFVKVPLFGWFYRKGAVLVDRKSETSRRKSFEEMKRVLAAGMHMSVYPEGTRNRTNEPLKKFYDGAFKLAESSGNAIIPGIILNTKKALPTHKTFYFLPKRLEIHFLEAIPVNGQTSDQLRDKTFAIMRDYYVANQH